jgi:hypothetical protein
MEVLIGKPSINGPFSMAMLNNQRVHDIAILDVSFSQDGWLAVFQHLRCEKMTQNQNQRNVQP